MVRDQIAAHEGDALISHEFFCSASTEQARRMVDQLAPATVHVIVTAREPLGLFTSSWQEHLKNKGTTPIEDYSREVSDDPGEIWNWRALDLGLVLERWGAVVPPELVHVITPPDRGEPRVELWRRFCSVLGVDVTVDESAGFANASMGVAEAETLRRVNAELVDFGKAFDRGVWIRSFLADGLLATRGGEPFWPGDDQIEDCRRRGEAAVELIRSRGYDVVGDLGSLLVPDQLPDRRHPDSVTDTEVAEVAVDLVASLLSEVRERTQQRPRTGKPRQAGQSVHTGQSGQSRARRLLDRLRRR